MRVVAIVKHLSSRGLSFRGKDEQFGTPSNGNFFMALELIAEFDPFLAEHIKKYGNAGSGTTSYLSKTTCNEFIDIMAKEVFDIIINEVKTEQYYSISVDSTPDISHADQLSFIVRYVSHDGHPTERFIGFIKNTGHKAEELFIAVTEMLEINGIDIQNCRGQSYDNAFNMSGKYSELQARIKEVNPLAVFIPCAGHSLNLVGTCAVESCTEAGTFFDTLQKLYNFFSSSTHRWEVLLSYLNGKGVPKTKSNTRWSAWNDAVQPFVTSCKEILQALQAIADDSSQKKKTRDDALSLIKQLSKLETAILASFWSTILMRFKKVSCLLQSSSIDMGTVVSLYKSLIIFVDKCGNNFNEYEEKGKVLSGKNKLQQY